MVSSSKSIKGIMKKLAESIQQGDKGRQRYSAALMQVKEVMRCQDEGQVLLVLRSMRQLSTHVPLNQHKRLLGVMLSYSFRGAPEVNEAFEEFLVAAITGAHNLVSPILEKLVSVLAMPVESDVGGIDWDLTDRVCEACHRALVRVIGMFPACLPVLHQSVRRYFPPARSAVHLHLVFLKNVIYIQSYCPAVTKELWNIILEKLVQLELHVVDDEPGEPIFEMEDEGRDAERLLRAEMLDTLMNVLFQWIKSKVLEDREYLQCMLTAYRAHLLLARGTRIAQYVLFVACTRNAAILAPRVVQSFFDIATDLGQDYVMRGRALMHAAGLMARLDHAAPPAIAHVTVQMRDWALQYLEKAIESDVAHADPRRHHLFYVLCHCMCYVICFRHTELPPPDAEWSSAMKNLFLSPLDPLSFIDPAVADEFVTVAYAAQLIDLREHQVLDLEEEEIDYVFPFEPYLLAVGNEQFIQPHYKEWTKIDDDAASSSVYGTSSPANSYGDVDQVMAMSVGTPFEPPQAWGEAGLESSSEDTDSFM